MNWIVFLCLFCSINKYNGNYFLPFIVIHRRNIWFFIRSKNETNFSPHQTQTIEYDHWFVAGVVTNSVLLLHTDMWTFVYSQRCHCICMTCISMNRHNGQIVIVDISFGFRTLFSLRTVVVLFVQYYYYHW